MTGEKTGEKTEEKTGEMIVSREAERGAGAGTDMIELVSNGILHGHIHTTNNMHTAYTRLTRIAGQ